MYTRKHGKYQVCYKIFYRFNKKYSQSIKIQKSREYVTTVQKNRIIYILTSIFKKTRNTVSNAHKMTPPAPRCFVWQSPCFAVGHPKIMRIKI